VNVTPDSFFDGGKYFSHKDAVAHALELVKERADIIDVGGESTRPFSEPVPVDEELRRVLPVIEALRAKSDVFISVDTYKSKVAEQAILAGADIVNDVGGLTFDQNMPEVICNYGVYAIIMHTKGTPRDMQVSPTYEDVIGEIKDFFLDRIHYAQTHGIQKNHLILDPGIGFGKRVEDNLRIIKMLSSFKEIGNALLIGTSMKSFIGHITDSPPDERIEGTLASIAIALWNGADIVRVHDVKAATKAVKLIYAIMQS
jgi:dihydropteroate synthase